MEELETQKEGLESENAAANENHSGVDGKMGTNQQETEITTNCSQVNRILKKIMRNKLSSKKRHSTKNQRQEEMNIVRKCWRMLQGTKSCRLSRSWTKTLSRLRSKRYLRNIVQLWLYIKRITMTTQKNKKLWYIN